MMHFTKFKTTKGYRKKKYQGLFDCWNLDDTRVSADAMKHVTCTLKMVYIESVTYFKSANSLKIVFKIVP